MNPKVLVACLVSVGLLADVSGSFAAGQTNSGRTQSPPSDAEIRQILVERVEGAHQSLAWSSASSRKRAGE